MSFVITGTGHRPDKLGGYDAYNPLRTKLMTVLEQRLLLYRVHNADLTVITGMALGFDRHYSRRADIVKCASARERDSKPTTESATAYTRLRERTQATTGSANEQEASAGDSRAEACSYNRGGCCARVRARDVFDNYRCV